jgi:hypothetical protein
MEKSWTLLPNAARIRVNILPVIGIILVSTTGENVDSNPCRVRRTKKETVFHLTQDGIFVFVFCETNPAWLVKTFQCTQQ